MSKEIVEFLTQEEIDLHVSRLPKSTKVKTPQQRPTRSPISGGLDKYSGEWDHKQASHLLRRTMLGPSADQIEWAIENGPDATVALLLTDNAAPDPPINYFFEEDPFTPIGETWIDKPSSREFQGYRRQSLFGWTMGLMLDEEISIRERLTLFWHNHFVTSASDIRLPKALYQYIALLREYSLGNFKELTKQITVNPAMLIYLNGNQNTKLAPNENYARELLELFTVGKGELAGPEDYTTFTELDVKEIAKVMTGWRVRRETDLPGLPQIVFNPFFHDETTKKLSHRFDNAEIENAGEKEYCDLIDIIFAHPEASRHLCRKLYRWFVYYKIDEDIEANVIEPMAQIFRDNNFEIIPVLEALLLSEHFYDVNSIGCIIKNPIEFVVSNTKQFDIAMPPNLRQQYAVWRGLFRVTELIQMVYYFPPSVAGWKAFYQGPSFNELWINAVTLITRQLYTNQMAVDGFEAFDGRFRINALEVTSKIENSENPNDLIQGLARIHYPVELTQEQIDVLKEILIPGLPDFEWTVEYQAYLDDPNNDDVKIPVETKLQQLIRAMLARPEYHLF